MKQSFLLSILLLLFLLPQSIPKQSPSTHQIITSLIQKLLKICQQQSQISFFECQQKLIQNDKKTGNYRPNYNYTKESVYMMAVYDWDKNGKLNWEELYALGVAVIGEGISDGEIQRKVKQIQDQYNTRLIEQETTGIKTDSIAESSLDQQNQQL